MDSQRAAHPHFDDRGTLDWNTRFADAFGKARAERKLLFIELGRQQCSQCRSLIEAVVPRPDVAPLLQERFVALAADADDTEDEVIELAQKLEGAMMLPFVMFTDSDGQFIEGSSGLVDPRQFAATLRRLSGA